MDLVDSLFRSVQYELVLMAGASIGTLLLVALVRYRGGRRLRDPYYQYFITPKTRAKKL